MDEEKIKKTDQLFWCAKSNNGNEYIDDKTRLTLGINYLNSR